MVAESFEKVCCVSSGVVIGVMKIGSIPCKTQNNSPWGYAARSLSTSRVRSEGFRPSELRNESAFQHLHVAQFETTVVGELMGSPRLDQNPPCVQTEVREDLGIGRQFFKS